MPAAPLYSSPAPLYSGEGISGDTPIAQTPGAPAAPLPTAPTGQTVNVISPEDGKAYGIDAAYLAQAKAQGYQVETPEHAGIRAWVEKNKGIAGAAAVAAKSLLNEATFGFSDPIVEKIWDPYQNARFKALENEYQGAHYAGAGLGTAVSFLYGGPLFKGVSKAGGVARAALLGAEEAVGKKLVAEAAYRVGEAGAEQIAKHAPSIARQIIAHAADYGVQGLAFASPKAAAQLITGDPDKAAETWIWGAAGGAALGGLVGGAKGLFGRGAAAKALPAAEEAAAGAEPTLREKVGGKLREIGDEQATSSLDLAKPYAKQLRRIKGFADAQKIVRDENLAEFAGDYEGMASKIGSLLDDAGQKIGAIKKAAGGAPIATSADVIEAAMRPIREAEKGMGSRGAASSVKQILEQEIFGPLTEGLGSDAVKAGITEGPSKVTWTEFMKGKMGPYMKSEGGHQGAIDRLAKEWAEYKAGDAITMASEAAPAVADLSLERLHAVRQAIDSLTRHDITAPNAVNALKKEVRAAVNDMINQKLEQTSAGMDRALLPEWKAANRRYQVLSIMKENAANNVERGAANRKHSLTDYLGNQIGATVGGFIGGGVGSLVGGYVGGEANNALRRVAPAYLSKAAYAAADAVSGPGLPLLERSFAEHGDELARIPSVLDRMSTGRPSASRDTMAVNLLTRFLEAQDSKLDDHKGLMAFADNLASLSANPDKMQAKIQEAIDPLQSDAPEVAMAVGAKLGQVTQYLAEQAPKSPYAVPTPFAPTPAWKPTDAQIRDYRAKVAVALDPYAAIDALGKGTLTKAHVDALQTLAPKLYAEMVSRIADYAASGKAPTLPYAQRLKLSMLTGAPLDRSLSQLSALQAVYQSKDAGKKESMGGGPKMKLPGAEQTDLARVSG